MYKYIIYDIEGFLEEGKNFKSFEEAEKMCNIRIKKIEESCKRNFENSLITSYKILKEN